MPVSRTSSAVSRSTRPDTAMSQRSFGDNKELEPETKDSPPPPPKEKTGCCGRLSRVVHGIWRTRLTEDTSENKELYITTTLRELIVYCIFLMVLMILTFGMTSSTMYYYTKVISDLFTDVPTESDPKITFKQINTIDKWWRFTKEPLMAGLHWDTWYNTQNVSDKRDTKFIFYENKLLGVPRLRQVRVRNDSCIIPEKFRQEIHACYAMYSSAAENKEPFGSNPNSSEWVYTSEEKLNGRSHNGQLGSYSGGGYYTDLTREKESSLELINKLWKGLWIDRGTRATFIDFTIYNANINLFCVVKLVMEFPATGGALPQWEFRTVKLLRYVAPMDYFVLACECIFMLFIVYYIVEEIIEIRKHKWSYFKGFWNWLDIVVITISLVCATFNIYRTIKVNSKLQQLLVEENAYPEFDFLSYWQQHFNHAIAIAVFFAWVKIFKYISFNKTMTQLGATLSSCSKDLIGFCVMFFIIFFAFAQLGYLLFGTQVQDFREVQHAIFTLFRIILGDFNFNEIQAAHAVLGPIFFVLYVFFVFFILINMFLAIINDTYSAVKGDLSTQKNDFEVTDYFKQRAGNLLDKVTYKRDRIVDIQKAIQSADINNDKTVDFNEWRSQLKMRGYADGEIEAMFAKYDEDGDRVLDEHEQKKMHMELEGQKAILTEELKEAEEASKLAENVNANNEITIDEFNFLSTRVDKLEGNLNSIVVKIDAVLCKLERIELAKLSRRETMRKLLDAMSTVEESKEVEEMVRQELNSWDREELFSASSSSTTSRR